MVWPYDPAYSSPICDVCEEFTDIEERPKVITAKFETSNEYPMRPSPAGAKHTGRFCTDCFDIDKVEVAQVQLVRYHYHTGDLLMVEMERNENEVRWNSRPEDAPEHLVELGNQVATNSILRGQERR